MNENTDMNDYTSKEFQDGYDAWCDMKGIGSNPHDGFSFEWVEWNQGWKEAQSN